MRLQTQEQLDAWHIMAVAVDKGFDQLKKRFGEDEADKLEAH
jgi:hypothetical protein